MNIYVKGEKGSQEPHGNPGESFPPNEFRSGQALLLNKFPLLLLLKCMYYTYIGSFTSPLPGSSCGYSYLTAEETESEHQVAIRACVGTGPSAPSLCL